MKEPDYLTIRSLIAHIMTDIETNLIGDPDKIINPGTFTKDEVIQQLYKSNVRICVLLTSLGFDIDKALILDSINNPNLNKLKKRLKRNSRIQAMTTTAELTQEAINNVTKPSANHFDDCLVFAKHYCRITHKRFSSEDMIEMFEACYPDTYHPIEKRVWGAVIRQLKKEGMIRHGGYGLANVPSSHMKPINLWFSNVFEATETLNKI